MDSHTHNSIHLLQEEEKQHLAAVVFENTTEAIIVTDKNNQIKIVNRAFSKITGYHQEEVVGKNPSLLSAGSHNKLFYEAMWKSLVNNNYWEGEIWNRRKNGEIYPGWLSITAIRDQQGDPVQYIGIHNDFTKSKEYEEKMWRLANCDALTNLPNRTLFMDRLSNALERAQREKQLVALLLIDLDRFKRVNDTLGHAAGDQLLQIVAERLTACVRHIDTIARLGGDEFTAILTGIPKMYYIERIAGKMLDNLAMPFFLAGDNEVFISGSIGITISPDDGHEVETLMKNADIAMYRAKQEGRNAYRFFTLNMNKSAIRRKALKQELHQALDREEFQIHYQPIIHLFSGQVTGAEALLRWNHPKQGIIFPKEFIPLTEEIGLIRQLGEWVMFHAIQQASLWHQKNHQVPIYLSVNFSSGQLRDPLFEKKLGKALNDAQLPINSFGLEVTETLVMDEHQKAAEILNHIKQMGTALVLDDFGTGYSSLESFHYVPIDILKIDQSRVQNAINDPADAKFTLAIIAMAHSMGMKVIAEGIETQEQLELLRQAGCDMAQGFYFSKPLPVKAFEAFTHF